MRDEDDIPEGLTREMMASQPQAATRADQDNTWRRRAPPAETSGGGGGSSVRSMMGGGAPAAEPGGSVRAMMAGAREGGGGRFDNLGGGGGASGPPPQGGSRFAGLGGGGGGGGSAPRDSAPPPQGGSRFADLGGGGGGGGPAPHDSGPPPQGGSRFADLGGGGGFDSGGGGGYGGSMRGGGDSMRGGGDSMRSGGGSSIMPGARSAPQQQQQQQQQQPAPSSRFSNLSMGDPRGGSGQGGGGGMAQSMDPRNSAPPPPPQQQPAAYKTREIQGTFSSPVMPTAQKGGTSSSIGGASKQMAPPPAAALAVSTALTVDQEAVPSRTIDLYWQSYPQEKVWIRKSRRETVKETKSRMPVVLRNLAPDTVFDPCIMWEKEKERVEGEKAKLQTETDIATAASSKKETSKKEKPKKLSKKEEMIEKNKKDSEDKETRADLEKLENVLKSCRNKAALGATIMMTKCATALGKLRQLLMVLDNELKEQNTPVALDALWAIENSKLYLDALAQEDEEEEGGAPAAAAAAAVDDKKGNKKDDEKKKKKEEKKKKEAEKKGVAPKKAERSAEAALCHDFRKELRAARKLRKERKGGLASFQLEEMYDRLPPLSPFLKGWRLDDWQKKVLRHVDSRRSAIVCAPTSSGKTVISTYTCVNYKRVLFCVPTEPLVWQVAAMFEKLLQGTAQVALATNQLAYRPSDNVSRVVVGTPLALESALVKIRGLVGDEVIPSKRWDYAQLEGGFDFEYAVFDEVHALDGDEGAALQRLIRSVDCPTLALSATIGNASELRDWWQSVRDDCVSSEQKEDEVVLVEHTGRFINVQNLVLDEKNTLKRLHPVAALTSTQLLSSGADKVAFALTPADASVLYKALKKEYAADVASLDPEVFFALAAKEAEVEFAKKTEMRKKLGIVASASPSAQEAAASVRARITLDGAKAYESALKLKLEQLAQQDAGRLESKVLNPFVPAHLTSAENEEEASSFSMLAAASDMRHKALFPALAFHLDSFRCLALFKSLLTELEAAQEIKYPTWADELAAKAASAEKEAETRAKTKERNAKEAEEEAKDGLVEEGAAYVDVTAPHPEFILAPPTSRLSAKEIDDILDELKKDKEALPASHILVRALRRGFGLYIDDAAFAVYRRVVQRLAQQGKLAIVFSDVSLAYGVNMPFRTVVFCGDEGGLLTPLLAQQMAGRAGRRGLDTQGNLVYLGMSWPRIRRLMVGSVPAIGGKAPHFATIALPLALSSEVWSDETFPPLCKSAGRPLLRRLCAASLAEYRAGVRRSAHESDDRVASSLAVLKKLGLWATASSASEEQQIVVTASSDKKKVDTRPLLCVVWELRDYLPESLALAYALPHLMTDFVKNRYNFKRALEDAGSEAVQIEFMAVLLHIVDRTCAASDATPMGESTWMKKSPERLAKWDRWETILTESQNRLDDLPVHDRATEIAPLRLSVPPGAPLDGMVFEVCKDRRMPTSGLISSLDRHKLKQRIWHVGNILMKAHNCLQLPGEFIALSPLLRKCCQRIKYILSDDINTNVDETVILENHDEEDEEDESDRAEPANTGPSLLEPDELLA